MKYPHLWLCAALAACSVYDDGLVERRRAEARAQSMENPSDEAGAQAPDNPTAVGGGDAAGSGGNTPAANGGTGGQSQSAAGSSGASSAPERTPVDDCGNGRLDDGERCDTAIASGKPGACPTSCTLTDPCQTVTLQGSRCTAECKFSARACANADKCCPAQCTPQNDDDCAPSCGDGILQADRGETCDNGPNAPASARCPTEADCEDGDACTIGVLQGSAAGCDAICKQVPITARHGDDGCCPAGANALVDSDCQPACGNGVKEASEACDGSTGCDVGCRLTLSSSQIQCMDELADDACDQCECQHCSAEMLRCSDSGNTTRDAACTAVEDCATKYDCAGEDCYCGLSNLLFCTVVATGPCRSVIERAAGTSNAYVIQADYLDDNTALGRAKELGACRRRYCSKVCP